MNISLNSAAESLIRQMILTGRFETPESVVETALFQTFSEKDNAPTAKKRLMDPPTSFDEGIVIELPRRPGVRKKAIPAKTRRLPDVVPDPEFE